MHLTRQYLPVLSLIHSFIRSLFPSTLLEDTENALEIEHGKFRWRGWTNPRDINKKEESLSEYNPDSEYDEIIEPFSLRNINLQIRKVSHSF